MGATPSHLAVGEGRSGSRTLMPTRLPDRPGYRRVVQTIAVGSRPSGITTGGGAVWVANSLDGTVFRIDPATNTWYSRSRRNGPVVSPTSWLVWVANTGDDTITGIDADSGRRRRRFRSPRLSSLSAPERSGRARARRVGWRASTRRRVRRADDHVGNGPAGIAFGRGAAWVANSLDGTVSRIDPSTNAVAASHADRERPGGDRRRLWPRLGEQQVRRHAGSIDPRTNQVTRRSTSGTARKASRSQMARCW